MPRGKGFRPYSVPWASPFRVSMGLPTGRRLGGVFWDWSLPSFRCGHREPVLDSEASRLLPRGHAQLAGSPYVWSTVFGECQARPDPSVGQRAGQQPDALSPRGQPNGWGACSARAARVRRSRRPAVRCRSGPGPPGSERSKSPRVQSRPSSRRHRRACSYAQRQLPTRGPSRQFPRSAARGSRRPRLSRTRSPAPRQ